MPAKDYSEEDDYYTQGFESDGVVSIWVGLTENKDTLSEIDVLQELCGVGYYDLDNQESLCFACESTSIKELLDGISYSSSFINEVIEAAHGKDVSYGRWICVQYDFRYNPDKVERKIASDPVYLGCFRYNTVVSMTE